MLTSALAQKVGQVGDWAGSFMEKNTKIAIIHRKRLFREGLVFALSQHQNITVVGSVARVCEILAEIDRLRPDVVIIDLSLPERDGLGEARRVRKAYPDIKILMMGLTESESDVMACIEAGATGYLLQEASLEDLLGTIPTVAAGEAFCSPKITSFLFSQIAASARKRAPHQARGLTHLTRREHEIITLIEQDLSNKEIAARLKIEIQTVKNHVHNILEKLQLNGRREVARYAREYGLSGNMH
jgi:two-component system, NarL family, nitrate/nitrite response regulator NarL